MNVFYLPVVWLYGVGCGSYILYMAYGGQPYVFVTALWIDKIKLSIV